MVPISSSTKKDFASTAERIADSLRADILRGRLKSRQPLRQDEIAAEFRVSKIPVREALFQLKAEGLVSFSPNRGAAVSEVSAAEADEIYTMRIALETVVLRRSIPRLTVADLSRAEEILDAIDHEQDVARWGELNWEFHTALYDAANMPRLMAWVKNLHVSVSRYLVLYLAGLDYQAASQREHREILEACRRGSAETAAACLEHHLRSASNQLISFLKQVKTSQKTSKDRRKK
jgi:DNA-binding GntR family transcriptional regulator